MEVDKASRRLAIEMTMEMDKAAQYGDLVRKASLLNLCVIFASLEEHPK